MIKKVIFCDTCELCETYSLEDYDRRNDDMPSWMIQANAWRGGEWMRKYVKIQEELTFFIRAEIKTAYENSLENVKIHIYEKFKNTYSLE
jgi:hypothetical protein